MFNPIKLMKIFEIAWLTIAGISLIMALYHTFFSSNAGYANLYLFVITGLGIAMFFIKRNSRHFLERRKAREEKDAQ